MSEQDQKVVDDYSISSGKLRIREIVEQRNIDARRINWILRAYGGISPQDPDMSIERGDA